MDLLIMRYSLLLTLAPGSEVLFVVVGLPSTWGGAHVELGPSQACEVGWIYDGAGNFSAPITLEEAKTLKMRQIDLNSEELFALGFLYQGLVFSLSLEAQANFARMQQFASELPYPFTVSTLDNQASITLANVVDVDAFVTPAVARVSYILTAGGAIKDQVRACTSIPEVAAVVDTRT